MSRPLRLSFENAVYHVTARGNRKDSIFFNEYDRKTFLDKINESSVKYSFIIFAYCLMNNHYHLFIKTPLPNISECMHYLNASYANWFKAKHKITGVVFQGRFKSIVVDEDSYAIQLSTYIHLNPFRVGLIERLKEYPWSSYVDYIDNRKSLDRLDTSLVLSQFSEDLPVAKKKYEAHVIVNSTMENPLKGSFQGVALGSEKFIHSIKERIQKIGKEREIPETRTSLIYTPEDIIQQVMDEFSITREDIFGRKKGNFYRQMTLALLKKYTALSLKEIGALFQMDYAAVSQACSRYNKKTQKML